MHSTFHIAHTLITLNLNIINSKSSEGGCVFYTYIYYKTNKIKNEFNIKPKSDLEHRTKFKGIIEIIKFLRIEAFVYRIDLQKCSKHMEKNSVFKLNIRNKNKNKKSFGYITLF